MPASIGSCPEGRRELAGPDDDYFFLMSFFRISWTQSAARLLSSELAPVSLPLYLRAVSATHSELPHAQIASAYSASMPPELPAAFAVSSELGVPSLEASPHPAR